MGRVSLAVVSVASLASAPAIWACPDCPTVIAAREQVLGEGLARNVMVSLAPFLAIGLVSLWAERIGKAR